MLHPIRALRPIERLRNRAGTNRRVMAVLAATAGLIIAGGGAGAAFAVSGGGYQPSQQGCQPGDSDYATPATQTYPGCHNMALNVESGGTTQGNASDTNTRYAQFGLDQSPNDPKSQGTPTPYSLGEPGYSGSPHAFCVSANTDGTGSAPAGTSTGAKPGNKHKDKSSNGAKGSSGQGGSTGTSGAGDGCGGNPNGAGFTGFVDYYQYYCPIAAMLNNPCEDTGYGNTTFTPYQGTTVAYEPIVDHGVLLYFGMDDNSDNGEHDGLGPYSALANQNNNGAVNGPSDGGSILLVLDPRNAAATPSQTHPEGAANASSGACADGICFEGTTQQQTVYHGCGAADANGQAPCNAGTPKDANVYDYAPGGSTANDPSVNSESSGCNAGGASSSSEANCGPGGMNAYRSATPANENAEPGVQVYSDPDPQRSPAAPSPFWPTPALYVGTCGVYAGSPATTGQAFGTSPTPVSNQAGQVAVDPNLSAC